MKTITRTYVRSNPNKLFLFGDNLERKGFGGQAAAMRDEPNAIGVPTKKKPSRVPDAYFTDAEFEQNKFAIDIGFVTLTKAISDSITAIVIPTHGLGTGRAQLKQKAPRTFAYLQIRLEALFEAFLTRSPVPLTDSYAQPKGIFKPESE